MMRRGTMSPPPPPKRRRRKGSTKLAQVEHHEKKHLDLDENNRPIRPTAIQFSTFLGTLTRNKVNISINEWKDVTKKEKNQCWSDILSLWDVPDTEDFKKYCLHRVQDLWKDFKFRLGRDYIFGGERMGQNPCERYSNIDPETWEKFVAYRKTDEFLAKREEQQARRAKNELNHIMSRGGYGWLEEERQQATLEEAMESEPHVVSNPLRTKKRHIPWCEGRKKKNGKYVNDKVEAVSKRIEELEEMDSHGSFTSSDPRMDILATAIGKLDNPGRVVGVPGKVGAKKFFGKKHRSKPAKRESVEEIEARGYAKAYAEFKSQNDLLTSQLEALRASLELSQQKGGTIPGGEPNYTPAANKQECYLHLDVPHMHPVAKAYRYPNDKIHREMPIQEGQVKVSVISVLNEEHMTPIPISDAEVKNISAAIGALIVWPKNLVLDTPQEVCPLVEKTFDGTKYRNLDVLWTMQQTMSSCSVRMDARIVHPVTESAIWLRNEDVKEFLTLDELESCWLDLSIRNIHWVCQSNPIKENLCRFLRPSLLAITDTIEAFEDMSEYIWMMQSYVELQMSVNRGTIYFAPILNRCHWALAIICPEEFTIFWFDSLNKSIRTEQKKVLEKGILRWHEAQKTKKICRSIQTINIKCPRQPGNTGYYVIRYMFDIIHRDIRLGKFSDFLGSIYGDRNDPFSQDEEIDSIRDELAGYFLSVYEN